MSCPLQVLRKQLYNIYHRKIYAVVRSVHLGPTPKTAQTEGRSPPQDLLGLDLDADPRRRDPPNHLVAIDGSRFSGLQVKVHQISRNRKSLRLMFHIQTSCSGSHVRSTRVPSEKEQHDKLEKTTLKSVQRCPQRNVAFSIEKWSLIFGLISQRIDKMHARRKSEGIICGRASIQWPTSTCCSCIGII